ncbi:MAG: hypothetical protein ACLVEJ_19325 [Parabacteroides sp.]
MKHLFYTFISGLLLIGNIQSSNAQDYPPNPLEKEGYRLIFHDEFDGEKINTDKWIPGVSAIMAQRQICLCPDL